MAFSASDIKNLALTEINHENILDWSDANNTDIPIVNQQYTLAKAVALSAYQWSFATRYTKVETYEYRFDLPLDLMTGIEVYTMPKATIKQTTGNSLKDLAVNPVTFTSQISQDGKYEFTYDGTNWKDIDNNIVNLADYGISYTQTPVATDVITVTYIAPKETAYISDDVHFYANEQRVYFGYINESNVQTFTVLDGDPISNYVSNFKRATLLPTDFLGYLVAYNDSQMNTMNDYLNVGTIIYTNAKELYLKYIANIEESALTPEFVDWFKTFFAMRLNSYLNGDMQRQSYLQAEEPVLFKKAKNIDSHKNPHQALSGNPFLWVRGKFGGGVI